MDVMARWQESPDARAKGIEVCEAAARMELGLPEDPELLGWRRLEARDLSDHGVVDDGKFVLATGVKAFLDVVGQVKVYRGGKLLRVVTPVAQGGGFTPMHPVIVYQNIFVRAEAHGWSYDRQAHCWVPYKGGGSLVGFVLEEKAKRLQATKARFEAPIVAYQPVFTLDPPITWAFEEAQKALALTPENLAIHDTPSSCLFGDVVLNRGACQAKYAAKARDCAFTALEGFELHRPPDATGDLDVRVVFASPGSEEPLAFHGAEYRGFAAPLRVPQGVELELRVENPTGDPIIILPVGVSVTPDSAVVNK